MTLFYAVYTIFTFLAYPTRVAYPGNHHNILKDDNGLCLYITFNLIHEKCEVEDSTCHCLLQVFLITAGNEEQLT